MSDRGHIQHEDSLSSPPPRLTLATAADAPLVHHIMHEAFAEYRGRLEPPSSAHAETVEDVRRAIAAGGAALAWDGTTAIGSARFSARPDHLYVGRVAVLPAYRGRGVATALMRFIAAHARTLGQPELRVEVRRALPSNVALYEGLGYAVISEQPHPRGPAFTTVIMAKRLVDATRD